MPAVRRGFRIAFWRASRPVTPRSRATGDPRNAATGRATSGPRATTPMSGGGGTEADEGERDVEHAERRADGEHEAADEEHPADHGPNPGRGHALDRDGPERGQRGHPRGGPCRAERRPRPSPRCRRGRDPDAVGRARRARSWARRTRRRASSAWSPWANPMPARTPRADAMTPTISVSMNVAVSTCRRVAPSARSKRRLTGALREHHREGVVDAERRHEHRDAAEHDAGTPRRSRGSRS